MNKGEITVAQKLKNDGQLLVKLTSVTLLMAAAQEKVNNYIKKNAQIFQEMKEDEEAMSLFNLYYEENEQELINAAAESLITSNEAEELLLKWREQDNGIEG